MAPRNAQRAVNRVLLLCSSINDRTPWPYWKFLQMKRVTGVTDMAILAFNSKGGGFEARIEENKWTMKEYTQVRGFKQDMLERFIHQWHEPGRSYFVYGGHGMGDYIDLEPSKVSLQAHELASILGRRQFEAIVFDACFMANLDCVYHLRHNTGFIGACEGYMWEPDHIASRHILNQRTAALLSRLADPQQALEQVQRSYCRHSPFADFSILRTSAVEDLRRYVQAYVIPRIYERAALYTDDQLQRLRQMERSSLQQCRAAYGWTGEGGEDEDEVERCCLHLPPNHTLTPAEVDVMRRVQLEHALYPSQVDDKHLVDLRSYLIDMAREEAEALTAHGGALPTPTGARLRRCPRTLNVGLQGTLRSAIGPPPLVPRELWRADQGGAAVPVVLRGSAREGLQLLDRVVVQCRGPRAKPVYAARLGGLSVTLHEFSAHSKPAAPWVLLEGHRAAFEAKVQRYQRDGCLREVHMPADPGAALVLKRRPATFKKVKATPPLLPPEADAAPLVVQRVALGAAGCPSSTATAAAEASGPSMCLCWVGLESSLHNAAYDEGDRRLFILHPVCYFVVCGLFAHRIYIFLFKISCSDVWRTTVEQTRTRRAPLSGAAHQGLPALLLTMLFFFSRDTPSPFFYNETNPYKRIHTINNTDTLHAGSSRVEVQMPPYPLCASPLLLHLFSSQRSLVIIFFFSCQAVCAVDVPFRFMNGRIISWEYTAEGHVLVALEDGTGGARRYDLLPRCPVSLASVPQQQQPASQEPRHNQQRLQINGVAVTCVMGSSSESDEDNEDEPPEQEQEQQADNRYPSHGDVLELVELGWLDRQPFRTVSRHLVHLRIPKGQFSRRFTLVGYDTARGVAFLLPEPMLVQHAPPAGIPAVGEERQSRFEPLPVVELADVAALLGPAFRDVTAEVLADAVRLPVHAPLADASPVLSPPLRTAPLAIVFGVTAGSDYLLTTTNRYVNFVGVAGGVPWVTYLAAEDGRTVRSPPTPLLQCHREKALLERFGLCDATGTVQQGWPGAPQRWSAAPASSCSSRSGRDTPRAYTPRRPCILGKRTSSPRPAPYTSVDASPVVAVTGPFGNKIQCQKDARSRFGVAFPDRLVGRDDVAPATWRRLAGRGGPELFSGKVATVMGLYNEDLVLLVDGQHKAVVLRSRTTREEVSSAFERLPPDTPPPTRTSQTLHLPAMAGEATARRSEELAIPSQDVQEPEPVQRRGSGSPQLSEEVHGTALPTQRAVFGSATVTYSMSQPRELDNDPCVEPADEGIVAAPQPAPPVPVSAAPPVAPPQTAPEAWGLRPTPSRDRSSASSSQAPFLSFSAAPLLNFLKAYAAFAGYGTGASRVSIQDVGSYYKADVRRLLKAHDRYRVHSAAQRLSAMTVEEILEEMRRQRHQTAARFKQDTTKKEGGGGGGTKTNETRSAFVAKQAVGVVTIRQPPKYRWRYAYLIKPFPTQHAPRPESIMDGPAAPAEMAPHGPATMLDHFMTRYDYDYNRDPLREYPHDNAVDAAGNDDAWLSGEVRNRPPFCMGGDWNGQTIYQQDYIPKSRFIDSMDEVQRRIGNEPYATAFIREWYRPDLTRNAEGGPAPLSEYQTEYTNSGRLPKGKPTLYAGATDVPYKEDFLHAKGAKEDDGSDLPPKITSEESRLPRRPHLADDATPWKAREELLPSRRPQLLTLPADPNDYWCTSWTYGDTSKAYPNQLPQGLEGSRRADLLGTVADKAELLRLLAGKGSKKAGRPYCPDDDTNPIYIASEEQRQCAVSHQLEDEGHVKMSMYMSDYINQQRLPDLPGNHGVADARNTQTSSLPALGEMAAGQITKYTREMGGLRNSHGYMKPIPRDTTKLPMPREILTTLRQLEKHDDVDKADPHRHKMHKILAAVHCSPHEIGADQAKRSDPRWTAGGLLCTAFLFLICLFQDLLQDSKEKRKKKRKKETTTAKDSSVLLMAGDGEILPIAPSLLALPHFLSCLPFASSLVRILRRSIVSQHNIYLAKQCVDRAKMEETPTGDPLVATRNYLSAMEYIQSAAASVAGAMQDTQERDFFLYQVKSKLSIYEERVRLLLGAAREIGLVDEPEVVGMAGLFGSNSPKGIDELLRDIDIPGNIPVACPSQFHPSSCDGFVENNIKNILEKERGEETTTTKDLKRTGSTSLHSGGTVASFLVVFFSCWTGESVDLYIPRKCHATNSLITSYDYSSVQIAIANVDASGIAEDSCTIFCIAGFVRSQGRSDHAINHLAIEHGLLRIKSAKPKSKKAPKKKVQRPAAAAAGQKGRAAAPQKNGRGAAPQKNGGKPQGNQKGQQRKAQAQRPFRAPEPGRSGTRREFSFELLPNPTVGIYVFSLCLLLFLFFFHRHHIYIYIYIYIIHML
eukprot:gene4817-3459_t